MNITKKVKIIRKLAKELEGEVEDNYFLMHSRKYYLKRGKIYTSNLYTKSVGSINNGEIELHKSHKKSKSRKVINVKPSINKNMSRRININKNKNIPIPDNNSVTKEEPTIVTNEEEPTIVTNLNRSTVMHETNEPTHEPEEPTVEESPTEPVEESMLEESAPEVKEVEEDPVEETHAETNDQ
jgi:hypothetical protein